MFRVFALGILQFAVLAVCQQKFAFRNAYDQVQPAAVSAGEALRRAADCGGLYFHAPSAAVTG